MVKEASCVDLVTELLILGSDMENRQSLLHTVTCNAVTFISCQVLISQDAMLVSQALVYGC